MDLNEAREQIKLYNPTLEMLKNAYASGVITEPMLRLALEKSELTLKEYVQIINHKI